MALAPLCMGAARPHMAQVRDQSSTSAHQAQATNRRSSPSSPTPAACLPTLTAGSRPQGRVQQRCREQQPAAQRHPEAGTASLGGCRSTRNSSSNSRAKQGLRVCRRYQRTAPRPRWQMRGVVPHSSRTQARRLACLCLQHADRVQTLHTGQHHSQMSAQMGPLRWTHSSRGQRSSSSSLAGPAQAPNSSRAAVASATCCLAYARGSQVRASTAAAAAHQCTTQQQQQHPPVLPATPGAACTRKHATAARPGALWVLCVSAAAALRPSCTHLTCRTRPAAAASCLVQCRGAVPEAVHRRRTESRTRRHKASSR
jgi:hypothetical protein